MPFYSVADNYTTNPRCERLNSLYCLGGLEPISRNSSCKCEWERLIPEYPFCSANGVPTLHNLLKYSLSKEKKPALRSGAGCRALPGEPWSSAHHRPAQQPPPSQGGCSITQTPSCPTLGTGGNTVPRAHRLLSFFPGSLGFVTHDRVVTVRGCCEGDGCVLQRGRSGAAACSRLGRWRRLMLAPCSGWCCLAVESSAREWQVPTESLLRSTKSGMAAERPSSCTRKCISFSALSPQHFRNLYLCFLHFY